MKLFWTKKEGEEQSCKRMGCFGKTLIGLVIFILICGWIGKSLGDVFATPEIVLEDNTIYRIDMSGELVERAIDRATSPPATSIWASPRA